MVPPEAPVRNSSNASNLLRRGSWNKAEAIRRGQLKISGPIPITEDVPLNEEEERKYAEKQSIEPATEHQEKESDRVGTVPEAPTRQLLQHNKSIDAGSHVAPNRVDVQQDVHESPQTLQHTRASTGMQKHTSSNMSASYNSPSPFPSEMTPRKKRKSGLRNVFRKMFGKKDKDEEESSARHGYHKSDPGTLTPTPEKHKPEPSAEPRISDLHVAELQPIHPLGSHLPFPMNINAPEQTSPPHDYLTFHPPTKLGPRRATLPSVVLSASEIQALSATWGSSGAKVTESDQERQDKPESIPSPGIGVAVSSPTRVKRRSRSASALRELRADQETFSRNRSAEIQFWRNSGRDRSVSVYSTHTPPPPTAETEQVAESVPREPEEEVPESAPSVPVGIPLEAHTQEEQIVSPIPIETFNFGNLKSEFTPHTEGDEVHATTEPSVALEERVNILEGSMQGLQSTVHRLTGRSHRQTIILENAPKGRRSERSPSRTGSRKSSKSSNRTLSGELSGPPSPTLAPTFLSSPSIADGGDRVQSAGSLSKTPSPNRQIARCSEPTNMQQSNPNAAEQMAAVYTILKHERTARKALEQQVIGLQRELSELRSLVHKFTTTASPYPTPSPDDDVHPGVEERLSTPRATRRNTPRGLGLNSEENMTGGLRRVPERERVVSRFSQTDSEGDEKHLEQPSLSSSSNDLASPDVWATPREERGFGFNGKEAEDEMF